MIAAESDLIPVRALNQVSYCPRLYFLEYVEAVMPINEHIEDGIFQHRRVDDPALEHRTRKEGACLHTRSVSLSSQRLGITSKLDLVEEKAGELYPVEYKRGSGPRGMGPPFWENDAIQVCAQGLLLEEEFGVPVPRGILYYLGTKNRVDVPFDDDLRAKTLAAIRLIKDLSERDTPPEPLPADLRYRCSGCSLVTICQPEETLFLLQNPRPQAESLSPEDEGKEPSPGLQRVLPACNDGAVLYLQEQRSYVGRRGEHLVVRREGEEINRVPLPSLRQVVVFGNVQLSTQALQFLAMNDIPVVYLTLHGRFIAALQPAPAKNVNLRACQYKKFSDPHQALELAKAVVKAKIANQRTLLMRSLRSKTDDPVNRVSPSAAATPSDNPFVIGANGPAGDISSLMTESPNETPSDEIGPDSFSSRGSDEPAARDMAELLARLERVTDPAMLLGTEGQAAALYFSQFPRMLKVKAPGRDFDFSSRNRRPPRDPVNALLSFAYAMLAKDCFSALATVGFDPYQGFYHTGRHGRPSLALDLMEEFRPVVADSVVLTMLNNRMLSNRDFLTWRDACQLNDEGRRRFFVAYEQRMATLVTHPVFGYRMTLSRMLEVQARMLAGYVRGDLPAYTGFTVR